VIRRQGEITRSDLKRKWPHHVAIPAEKVRGLAGDILRCRCPIGGADWRRDDSDFVVFCFSKSEDAEAFAKRFDGNRLRTGSRQ
jgi:hypothetical protein